MNGPRLLAALEALLPFTEAIEDEGPIGSGWKSDELAAARAEAEAAILESKSPGVEVDGIESVCAVCGESTDLPDALRCSCVGRTVE